MATRSGFERHAGPLEESIRKRSPYIVADEQNEVARRALVQILAIRSWQLKHDGQFPDVSIAGTRRASAFRMIPIRTGRSAMCPCRPEEFLPSDPPLGTTDRRVSSRC